MDDDEDIRVSLERGLRLSGFSVRTVAGGAEALAAVAEREPSCIVLDVDMPGMDGMAVVTRLRELNVQAPRMHAERPGLGG